MEKRKNIYSGIDIFKFVFSIFVVIIHTIAINANTDGLINKFFCNALTIAVPYFFVAFGFLMQGDNEKKFLSSERILRSLKKMIKMYFIWTIIYFPITIGYHIYNGTSLIKAIILIIRGVFFIGENYNSWPLWYLFSTICALVLFYVFSDKLNCKPWGIVISSVIIFGVGVLFVHFISDISVLSFLFPSTRMFVGMFCIIPGVIIAYNKEKIFSIQKNIRIIIFSVISIALFLIKVFVVPLQNYVFLSRLNLTLLATSLFIISISFLNVPNKLCVYMRISSKVIYLTHMLFYTLYCIFIAKNQNGQGINAFIFTIVCSLVFSLIVIYFNDKSKIIKILFT